MRKNKGNFDNYPDHPLKEQVRSLDEVPSCADVIRKHFFSEETAIDGKPGFKKPLEGD